MVSALVYWDRLNFLALVHSFMLRTEAASEEISWKASRMSAPFRDEEVKLWLLLLPSFEIPCE